MQKWVGGLLTAFVVLVIAAPVSAGGCTAMASPDPAWHGAEMTVSASGFAPGEDVFLYFPQSAIRGVQVADGNGAAMFSFTLEDDWPSGASQSWYVTNRDASCSTGGSHLINSDPPPTTTEPPTTTSTDPATTTTVTTEPATTTSEATTTTTGSVPTTVVAALPVSESGSNTTTALLLGVLIGGVLVGAALLAGMWIGQQRRS